MSVCGSDYTGIHIYQNSPMSALGCILLHINDNSINLILKVKMLYYKKYIFLCTVWNLDPDLNK